jgi:hypothetical protein
MMDIFEVLEVLSEEQKAVLLLPDSNVSIALELKNCRGGNSGDLLLSVHVLGAVKRRIHEHEVKV